MKSGWHLFIMLIIFTALGYDAMGGIAASKHNLSVSGSGEARAVAEEDICVFCHIPHNDNPSPSAWNRKITGNYYTPYSSSTAVSAPGQPNGTSILCLSCHDGTIALGDVISAQMPIPMVGGISTMTPGPAVLGTDLSDDHPISFIYDWGLASRREDLVQPSLLTGKIKLDNLGRVQCTSCHDPHDDKYSNFLNVLNRNGQLCTTCHGNFFQWRQSSHGTSIAGWNATGIDPWPNSEWRTVAENACGNCHQPHSADGHERLLKYKEEEYNCLLCHSGTVSKYDLSNVFNKFSRHPIEASTGIHDPAEPAIITSRHVECVDCHNPHASTDNIVPSLGALAGVRGISIDGIETKSVSHDYELCFRCHGDGYDKPAPRTPRQLEQQNVREEFSPNNPSYHPVTAIGKNQDVPSLLLPFNINSTFDCSGCHDNDDSTNTGGIGPRGPHGSNYPPILSHRYETLDNTTESPSAYALCYKCHDRNSILGDQSFKSHRLHIVQNKTSCNTCHDPHGISYIQGNTLNNKSLINFDISIVSENSMGNLRYESTGKFSGNCYLMCHGSDHVPQSY